MNGAALGTMTAKTISRRRNRYAAATSRETGSTWCTPYMACRITGHTDPTTTSSSTICSVAP